MGLLKSSTRRLRPPGYLGPVQRSIGYLQGGYYTGTGATQVQSKVQLFNTTTQVGQIVYDTGYQRYYRPGISGGFSGYFSISDTSAYSKFSYATATSAQSFSYPGIPQSSASDLNIYSQAWVTMGTAQSASSTSDWMKLDMSTDTPIGYGAISTLPIGTTRQAMSTGATGFFINSANNAFYSLAYATQAFQQAAALDGTKLYQFTAGMSVSNTLGYWVCTYYNARVNISGSTVTAVTLTTQYTYQFAESHSLVSATAGYMMAGYADTTGRYNNVQHALCQRMTLATEAISTLPDLVLPQSSGQMMQGF